MASRIPDSRFGRAMKAGIPVALILLGAEAIDGSWRFERSGAGVAVSWTRTSDSPVAYVASADATPNVRIQTCLGGSCERKTFVVSLPRHHMAGDMASLARTMMDLVTGDCAETGKRRTLAMA